MPLTREMMREAGSKAFFALKKYKLYESNTEGSLTTLSLFGDTYRFFFDSERKIAWMRSKHHYQKSSNFKLATRHKEWEGIFSFPRSVVADEMRKVLDAQKIEVRGEVDNKKLGTEIRIVATQAYNADKRKLGRIFGGVLWKHYDHEIACLAMKVYGLSASALDYSIIANNKEEFLDTLNKAPAVLPIWRDLVLVKMHHERIKLPPPPPTPEEIAEGDAAEDDFFTALLGAPQPRPQRNAARVMKDWNNIHPNYDHPGYLATSLNYPEEARTFHFPDIIKRVKNHLDGRGLTSAGWRFLLKILNRFMRLAAVLEPVEDKMHLPVEEVLDPLTHLLGVTKPGAHHRRQVCRPLKGQHIPQDRLEETVAGHNPDGGEPVDQLHEVPAASGSDNHLNGAGLHDGAEDVYRNPRRECRQVQLDSNQRKADWKWFMRQQEAWHRDVAAREAERHREQAAKAKDGKRDDTWDSAIPEIIVKKKYKVVPLNSTYALIDEGRDMHHCVGSYSRNCIDNLSRVFSIRGLDGSRVATLELRNEAIYKVSYPGEKPKGWVVNQCRGVCNDDVSAEVKSVAQEVARRYNKALGIGVAHFAQEEAIAV
jgi:hypothetical protein